MRTFLTFIAILFSLCAYTQYENNKVYRRLKKAIRNKDKVEILSLYGKELKEFPDEIFEFKNLKVLNLANNNIENIPDEIKRLEKLESLVLMKNRIQELPQAVVELKYLTKINVAYNELGPGDVIDIQNQMPNCLIITYIEL